MNIDEKIKEVENHLHNLYEDADRTYTRHEDADTAIKTYRTAKQAESGCSSWDRDFEIVECKEIIDIGGQQ